MQQQSKILCSTSDANSNLLLSLKKITNRFHCTNYIHKSHFTSTPKVTRDQRSYDML